MIAHKYTKVNLDKALGRLNVPNYDLVMLLEADDDSGAVHRPVDASNGALRTLCRLLMLVPNQLGVDILRIVGICSLLCCMLSQ